MKTNRQTKKLSEICEFYNGLWKGKEAPYINVGVIRNTNFTKDGTLDDTDIAYLPVEIKQFSKRKLSFGDIILEKSGGGPKQPVGRVIVFDKKNGDYSFSNFTSAIRIKNSDELDFNFLHKFLYFSYISGITESMQSHSTGIRNLDLNTYKEIEISYPPLFEQKRIVKTIDEAFKKLEKANEIAKKNLNNSRDLFKTYLNSIFLNGGKDWDERTIADVCEVEYGYTEKAKAQGDYRFVRITDTDENGLLTQENKMYVASFKDAEKYLLSNGDLLMARTGASAGNVLFFESEERSVFASYLIRMKFDKGVMSKLYWHFSKSKQYWDQVKQLSAGSAQPQFNGGALKKIVLPFPKSQSEQKAIIKKLDQLSEQTKKLESIYQKKLSAIEELKRSILSKAFSKGL
jgi:type I restriction enzyme S subunit